MVEGQRCLVTGGAGTIGSTIVDQLVAAGADEIIVLDNLVRGRRENLAEALTSGRFFRLVDGSGRGLAIGRLYDPSGEGELAPLDDFGRQNLGARSIEFRSEGDWQAA